MFKQILLLLFLTVTNSALTDRYVKLSAVHLGPLFLCWMNFYCHLLCFIFVFVQQG